MGKADLLVEDGDELELGDQTVRVLHTPGHSRGGICLLAGSHLFSGDTLFVGSVGRTDLPGASWKVLSASLREKVLSLPGDTRLWPGHHYGSIPTNLLEAEKRTNPFLREIHAVIPT
jgi:glyoxylase-like metal-dependent hydrolase (beta-lactamase superfamily II)